MLAGVVAAADLATAAWARAYLHAGGAGWGPVRLGLVANRGVAFGIGAAHPGWAMAVSAVMIVVLAVWMARTRPGLQRWGLALALGGGAGNLVDRLARGSVTDWIHVAWYAPTFNLADVAIRLGLLMVLVALAWHGAGHGRIRRLGGR